MSENREIYEREMNAGHESAWEKDWKSAANHYGRALHEFPNDTEAHLNLGFALLQADRLDDALRIYTRAQQLSPDDPIPTEKSANVLEQMGRLKESAQQYATVAELYLKQRDIKKAIENWEKATEITPGLVAIHAKLATAYRKIGDKRHAIYHYLMVASNLSRSSNPAELEQGRKAAQRALALDKRSVEALSALAALDAHTEVQVPSLPPEPKEQEEEQPSDMAWTGDLNLGTGSEPEVESDPMGPMGMAVSAGLSTLAEHIMMSGGLEAGGVEALQAMELQRQGSADAIKVYKSAAQNMRHPALSMNLGALQLLSEQPDEAIPSLNAAAEDGQLRAGAYHALGQAYYQQEKFKRAVNFFAQVGQLIDEAQAESAEEREAVDTVYSAILSAIKSRNENDQTLAAVSRRFMRLLSGKEWERRLRDARYQMLESHRDGGGNRILEMLAEDIGEGVTDSVAKIDRYIRQGLYILAMDEAQYGIEKAPTYLPIHVRMAEVMMLEGRVRQAVNKYNVVAKTYRVRGENGRAASILFEVLEMSPFDTAVRKNLIELLESEERWEESLDQHASLGNIYRQIGDLDAARASLTEAERLAERVSASADTRIAIKHTIADIEQLRMDMRRAQRIYDDIVALVPEDERARRALVEINLQLGNQIEATNQLDALLRLYAKHKQVKKILKLLQDLVRTYPDETGLRSRLAAIYRQLGRKEDAIEQLDRLATLQLDAGLTQDACDTVKQIIRLKPPNMDQFEEKLRRLSC